MTACPGVRPPLMPMPLCPTKDMRPADTRGRKYPTDKDATYLGGVGFGLTSRFPYHTVTGDSIATSSGKAAQENLPSFMQWRCRIFTSTRGWRSSTPTVSLPTKYRPVQHPLTPIRIISDPLILCTPFILLRPFLMNQSLNGFG